MSLQRLFIFLLALLLPLATLAEEPKVMVRTAVLSKGPAVAGQQVRLRVDALTTTWFLKAPVYPQISAPNAVINLLDEQADHLNETINGEKWFGLSRSYLVTPTGNGDIVVPSIEIIMVPGQGSGAMKARTHEVKIAVKAVPRPAGTENMLASTHVTVSQRIDRKLDALKVGDAFTRTVVVQGAGVQGMFIPPTTFPQLKGMKVYPKTGKVDNIIKDRVGFLGSTRTDAATYVVQQAGDYDLPAITVEWWNTASGKIEKSEVPALHFSAAPNPGYQPEFELPTEADTPAAARLHLDWHQIGTIAGLLAVAILALWWLTRHLPVWWKRLRTWQRAHQQHYEASERAAFRRFTQATKQGNAAVSYTSLLAWAEHPDCASRKCGMDALWNGANGPALAEQFDRLRAALYGNANASAGASEWKAAELCRLVTEARAKSMATQNKSGMSLGPLNP